MSYQGLSLPYIEQEGEEPEGSESGSVISEVSAVDQVANIIETFSPDQLSELNEIIQSKLGSSTGTISELPEFTGLDDEEFKKLKKGDCYRAGGVYRQGKDGRKSVCARRPRTNVERQNCIASGNIWKRGTRDSKGKVVKKPACIEPKSPKKEGVTYFEEGYSEENIPGYQEACEGQGQNFRKQYTTKSGKVVRARCIKKKEKKAPKSKSPKKSSSKSKSPKKSPSKSKSPKKSCPSGKVYRKSYKPKNSNKRVAAKCVKKGGRGRPKSSKSKSRSK